MKVLAICPSKYPDKLEKMLDSFAVTRSKHIKIIINYEDKPITEIFNKVFNANPNEDFYMMLNDDIIFQTPLWDLALAQKGKISYGDDGFQGKHLPTFPMIDGDIIRALGWLQMPLLKMYCGDTVWDFIGKECNCLNYCEGVKIQHTWNGCADPELHKADMAEFAKWLPWSFKDVAKVRKVLNGIS